MNAVEKSLMAGVKPNTTEDQDSHSQCPISIDGAAAQRIIAHSLGVRVESQQEVSTAPRKRTRR